MRYLRKKPSCPYLNDHTPSSEAIGTADFSI